MGAIHGIGVDIVQVKRIFDGMHSGGDKFLNKILTKEEASMYVSKKHCKKYFAKRFAAKEAFSKALGTGIGKSVGLLDISVLNDEYGKPYFVFNDKVKDALFNIGAKGVHLSLSDEEEYAVAFVTIEN